MRTTTSILIILVFAACIHAQSTDFTYQGRLTDGTLPPTGTYQMQFSLFGSLADPDQIGSTITVGSVAVTQGIFTVTLNIDVPNAFDGGPRWLAIAVKRAADPDYTPLNPRQPVTSTPYAIKSSNASTADLAEDSTRLGGKDASEFVFTTAGPASPQSGNFNVSGTGTLGNLSVGNGTAGAPSVSFSGDTDTGLFRSAVDTLDFSTAGVSRIQIGPDGRVGIGTAPTAAARLSVFDAGATPGAGTGGSFAGGSIGISGFGNGATSTASSFGVLGTAGGSAGSRFGVGGFTNSETGVQQAFGVLGVSNGPSTFNYGVYGSASGGTTNWAGYFDGNTFTGGSGIIRARINSDLNAGIALTLNDQPGWSMATVTGGQFQIFNDFLGQNAVWIQRANNNVGIGTTAPGSKLDVAGDINASTQYNIGGNRILSNPGTRNLFAGEGAGQANTSGDNSFFGWNAGRANTTGGSNSFFGMAAGNNNTTGGSNSFFGRGAGGNNTSGAANSFFGFQAGVQNTLGIQNSFFGTSAGGTNVGGSFNAFFGFSAGTNNLQGFNSFFGWGAGLQNTMGFENSFFGIESGRENTTASRNSFFGARSGLLTTTGDVNSFFGYLAGHQNATGTSNAYFGEQSGRFGNGSFNTFVGQNTGAANLSGTNITLLGRATNVTTGDLTYSTAIGADAIVGTNDTIVLGKLAGTYHGAARPADTVRIPGNLTVLGTLTANLPIDSTSYILNSAAPQASSNFNISGNGTVAGTLNAGIVSATQFNTGLSRVFKYEFATGNTYAGFLGNPAQSGTENSFFGNFSGLGNSGSQNSIFGSSAGRSNNTGNLNSFFGVNSGFGNTGAFGGSFFGANAGRSNQTGNLNSFFGFSSGQSNTLGEGNTFFGANSGSQNTEGLRNTLLGNNAGSGNTLGNENTFVGDAAGDSNTTGNFNTMIGANADVLSAGLQFATAIGAGATINRSNQIVLGRSAGQDEVIMPGNTFVNASLTANTFTTNSGFFGGTLRLGPQGANPGSCTAAVVGTVYYRVSSPGVEGSLVVCTDLAVGSFEWVRVTDGTVQFLTAGSQEKLADTNKNQQAQIEQQQKKIDNQQRQIDALKKFVCSKDPNAEICKE